MLVSVFGKEDVIYPSNHVRLRSYTHSSFIRVRATRAPVLVTQFAVLLCFGQFDPQRGS
jgi:hypothetical protein